MRERLALLKDDYATLEEVESQLQVYQDDLTRDFEFRMADIDKILLEMERRGHDYFDDTLRIGRVMDLLNRSRIQQGFEQRVVARRAAADRTQGRRTGGLARRRRPAAVAGCDDAPSRAAPPVPRSNRRETMPGSSTTTGPA